MQTLEEYDPQAKAVREGQAGIDRHTQHKHFRSTTLAEESWVAPWTQLKSIPESLPGWGARWTEPKLIPEPLQMWGARWMQPKSIGEPINLRLSSTHKPSWLPEASAEIEALYNGSAIENQSTCPSREVADCALELVRICQLEGTSDPAISHDDEGGIEIFLKEGNSALLLAIRANGLLQIFGDSKNEQWRGRYSLPGDAWKRHLRTFLLDLFGG
jgi:hypothetical protein